jgi:hypothetical protein
MQFDKFIRTGVAILIVTGLALVSCNKKSNPAAPAGIDFHITSPKAGASFDMGTPVMLKWTLPADSSIDSVIVYEAKDTQQYVPLNQYSPVLSPVDSFQLYIGSDNPGKPLHIRIQNKADSTEKDEITINENPYQN